MNTRSAKQHPRVMDHARRTLDEAITAAFIGTSPSSLRNPRTTRTPSPPYSRGGRRVRYRVDDLNAWLKARRVVFAKEAS